MTYVDRAVVKKLGANTKVNVLKPDDLLTWDEQKDIGNDILIGQGSFGKVFLKRHHDEAVVVKVPSFSDYYAQAIDGMDDGLKKKVIDGNRARITMEAMVYSSFAEHDSFPKLSGIVDLQGVPSLVMEFIGDKKTGKVYPLNRVIKARTPSLSREAWLNVVTDIVHGVKAMHENGLLHNDIKANNFLLQWDEEANRWRAVIIDMGKVTTLAMPPKNRSVPKEEVKGYRSGTLFQHLAPEYILDLEPTSVHTDIYSLGKLLSQMEVLIKSQTLRRLAAAMTQACQAKPRLRPSWKYIENAICKAEKKTHS